MIYLRCCDNIFPWTIRYVIEIYKLPSNDIIVVAIEIYEITYRWRDIKSCVVILCSLPDAVKTSIVDKTANPKTWPAV